MNFEFLFFPKGEEQTLIRQKNTAITLGYLGGMEGRRENTEGEKIHVYVNVGKQTD